jgi:diaminohydroxyphosphoribosylaminopyrimidine deaminase/5-amino-6-(5-phosphoribosylamino)uracil reductase
MMWSDDDIKFMSAALDVAVRGKGKVSPNPLVGCVLVKDGQIIAEGWHDHLGGLHAEQMAIHDAETKGESPNGATAYVTLEPCNHFGRTPPCTEALMWAGVKSVIVAHADPNPTVRGQGITVLQEAGISVKSGLLEGQAADQMRPFLHWCQYRKPIVTVKMAVDCNGSVDDRSKDAGRFTSEKCLDLVHQMRAESDAILVGVETIVRDDPSLLVSRVETSKQPLRIVIDPNARIPTQSQVLNDGTKTLVLQDDFRDLANVLNRLGDMEIQTLMVEGGPVTVKHFLEEKLVDEFYLVQSTIEHQTPYESGIDSQVLSDAGLIRADDQKWGDEIVQYWSR